MTPLDLAADLTRRLDDLHIPYVIGGSVAASLVGEPRSTADIDIAVAMTVEHVAPLLAAVAGDFYVPSDAARHEAEQSTAFNLIDRRSALKVDLFVLGDDLLDRLQLERRQSIELPIDPPRSVWVTSAEDVVLRKLRWFVDGGRASDQQCRDIVGVLRHQRGRLDEAYLDQTATATGLISELEQARLAAST